MKNGISLLIQDYFTLPFLHTIHISRLRLEFVFSAFNMLGADAIALALESTLIR